jgi:hypothetical protein
MNQERFDDLTHALATGRISRRQVLKAAAGAAVGRGRYSSSAKPKRHRRLTWNAFTRVSKVTRR